MLGRCPPPIVAFTRRNFATSFTTSASSPRQPLSLRSHSLPLARPLQPALRHPKRLHALASPMPAERNGDSTEAHSKRKQPPTPSNERPMKQIKPETDTHTRNGTYVAASPDLQERDSMLSPGMDLSLDDLPSTHVAAALHDTAEWQKTIEKVVKSVVSIHFCQTCSFDTDAAVSSEATGFVVDAERGYILTNRVCVPWFYRWL